MSSASPVRCAACGSADAAPAFRGLVSCRGCGLVYYPRAVPREELASLYGEGYFRGEEYLDYPADAEVHRANFRARVRDLRPWIADRSRVFEIGCAYGFFLDVARTVWRVAGCDVSPAACAYARERLGLDVACGDFLALDLAAGEVDAFVLWDTIEHLGDPAAYLAKVATLTRPGGVLALTTGDLGSPLARFRGARWRQIHPPTHLWYFSRKTLSLLVEKHGFEVVACRRVGMWRSLGQVLAGRAGAGDRNRGVLAAARWTGIDRLRIWLNSGDLLFVVARRR